jgi:energy-coupling factor transporter ATP-binding protein EcfA2
MYRYCAYGLQLVVNAPIPGLLVLPPEAGDNCDRQIWLDRWPDHLATPDPPPKAKLWYTSRKINPNLKVWQLADEVYWFRYRDGAEFLVDNPQKTLWARWQDPLTVEDAATYLLGPILGFILRSRGVICLHASAVAVEGRAIAFVGQAGAGKSTTAAAFACLGYPVLTDDVLALTPQNSSYWVQPAYPGVRLWDSSVAALFGHAEALPRLVPTHPTWDKRYLDLTRSPYSFQTQPIPLACIYLLDTRQSHTPAGQIIDISPQEGAISLIANTYTNYLLNKSMRAIEFQHLGQLLKSVQIRRLHPHTDFNFLPDTLKSIVRLS